MYYSNASAELEKNMNSSKWNDKCNFEKTKFYYLRAFELRERKSRKFHLPMLITKISTLYLEQMHY